MMLLLWSLPLLLVLLTAVVAAKRQVVWVEGEEDDLDVEAALGPYAIEGCRIDLLPTVAMERLGLHNELCGIKWKDGAQTWMREGFAVSARFDSMKRHYEGVHAQDRTEDHLAHLIWGFMVKGALLARPRD